MIESINTLLIQSSMPVRDLPSATVQGSDSASAASQGPAVTTFIRVDNLQNAVILESVSSETGEVISQIPTQAQILAYREAAHLRLLHEDQTKPSPAHEATVSRGSADKSIVV